MVIPGRLIWEQGGLLPIAAARGLEVVLGMTGSSVAQRWILGLSSMARGFVQLCYRAPTPLILQDPAAVPCPDVHPSGHKGQSCLFAVS